MTPPNSTKPTSNGSRQSVLLLAVVLAIASVNTNTVNAFTTAAIPTLFTTKASSASSTTRLYSSSKNRKNDEVDDDEDAPSNSMMMEDLESARAAFEKLIAPEVMKDTIITAASPSSKTGKYQPPPLTENSRHRREIEIELLEDLKDSDDAIDEIMSLWMTERNYEATMELQSMEQICSPGLIQEEQLLLEMIYRDSTTSTLSTPIVEDDWAEPMVRLATLYYYQGQSDLAYYWCSRALEIKPWHFEVGHTLVLLALRQENLGLACHYRRTICLPPLNPNNDNKKRKEWVSRAIENAKYMIELGTLAREELYQTTGTTTTSASATSSSEFGDNGEETWQ